MCGQEFSGPPFAYGTHTVMHGHAAAAAGTGAQGSLATPHMPGFRSLSDAVTGSAAAFSRDATALEGGGDHLGAIALYERALEFAKVECLPLPGFVCGRLAASYRRARRYQDELDLLERYRDSQTDEVARSRFDARMSKARALVDKHHRHDSAALASVRAIKPSARRNRRHVTNGDCRDAPPTDI